MALVKYTEPNRRRSAEENERGIPRHQAWRRRL